MFASLLGALPVRSAVHQPASANRAGSMAGDTPSDPHALDDLSTRIRRARGEDKSESGERSGRGSMPTGGLAMAMRIGVELVAGVGVGAGIGYFLDRWLGTGPWLLILFFSGRCRRHDECLSRGDRRGLADGVPPVFGR